MISPPRPGPMPWNIAKQPNQQFSAVLSDPKITKIKYQGCGRISSSAGRTHLGLGLVHPHGPPVEFHPVDLVAGRLGLLGRHGNEREAPGTSGVPVARQEAVGDRPVLLEHAAHGLLVRVERQVAHVELDVLPPLGVERAVPPGPGAGLVRPAGAGTLPPGAGLVDPDGPPVELALVHLGYGVLGRLAGGEGDEPEAPGAGRAPLHGEEDVGDGPEGAEDAAELGLVRGCVFGGFVPAAGVDFAGVVVLDIKEIKMGGSQ